MTDAREIIARAAEDKLKFDGFSSYDEMAEHLMQALTATGFRILGPDEVDPVTEAMVEAAQRKYREIGERCNWQHSWPSADAMREILKAAMEVGR